MAGSVNKVILVGNLGRDPDIRHTQSGKKIANLALATSDSWKDRQTGERRERTEWHRVVIFSEGLADVAERFLRKGSKVYVEGALQTRKWQDQSGQERYTTEVVLQAFNGTLTMLDGRGGGDRPHGGDPGMGGDPGPDEPAFGPSAGRAAAPDAGRHDYGGSVDLDDDIPF